MCPKLASSTVPVSVKKIVRTIPVQKNSNLIIKYHCKKTFLYSTRYWVVGKYLAPRNTFWLFYLIIFLSVPVIVYY